MMSLKEMTTAVVIFLIVGAFSFGAYINSSLNKDATVSPDLVEVAEAFESAECDK